MWCCNDYYHAWKLLCSHLGATKTYCIITLEGPLIDYLVGIAIRGPIVKSNIHGYMVAQYVVVALKVENINSGWP